MNDMATELSLVGKLATTVLDSIVYSYQTSCLKSLQQGQVNHLCSTLTIFYVKIHSFGVIKCTLHIHSFGVRLAPKTEYLGLIYFNHSFYIACP